MHHRSGAARPEKRIKLPPEFVGPLEGEIRIVIGREESVACAGNVTANWINRFNVTPIPLGGARIQDEYLVIVRVPHDVTDQSDLARIRTARQRMGPTGRRFICGKGAMLCLPANNASIQQSSTPVSDPSGEPPETCREGASHVVISDDRGISSHAVASEKLQKIGGRRQRVASIPTRLCTGEVGLDPGKMRPRQMSFKVELPSPRHLAEVMAAVENDPIRIVQVSGKVLSADEHGCWNSLERSGQ